MCSAEAEFAGPEALATAVGAGFILGPVGGLAVGIAQGLLMKGERQGLLDAYAADSAAMQDINEIYTDQLDQREMMAETPEDLAQINGLRAEQDAAMRLSASGTLQAEGAAAWERFSTNLNAFDVANEAQRIAREVKEADDARLHSATEISAHRALLGDFRSDSANFEVEQNNANNTLAALNSGTGASLTAALASMPIIVNPEAGATTEAEVDIWRNINGTIESLTGRIQQELGSGGLTDPTRKEIIKVVQQYKQQSIASQQAREAYYGTRLEPNGIPQRFAPEYNLSARVAQVREGGFVRGKYLRDEKNGVDDVVSNAVEPTQGIIGNTIDEISMSINDTIDEQRYNRAYMLEFFKIHGRYPTAEDNPTK
jgi:hypothetical protein